MSFFANPRLLQPGIKMGPSVQDAKVDLYSTPASKYVWLVLLYRSEGPLFIGGEIQVKGHLHAVNPIPWLYIYICEMFSIFL